MEQDNLFFFFFFFFWLFFCRNCCRIEENGHHTFCAVFVFSSRSCATHKGKDVRAMETKKHTKNKKKNSLSSLLPDKTIVAQIQTAPLLTLIRSSFIVHPPPFLFSLSCALNKHPTKERKGRTTTTTTTTHSTTTWQVGTAVVRLQHLERDQRTTSTCSILHQRKATTRFWHADAQKLADHPVQRTPR